MSGRLIAHGGAEYHRPRRPASTRNSRQRTDTWTPIPHYDLVTALEGQLQARGISIVKEQFAVQKAKLFGVIDTDYQVTEEGGAAIGIRTANDKSLALQLAIGYRVFVCDNMSFHGDLIALKRKHTANLDLHTEFATGIGRYVQRLCQTAREHRLVERACRDERTRQAAHLRHLQPEDCPRAAVPSCRGTGKRARRDNTMWRLHNCLTTHIKTLKPAPAFTATLKLSRFFEKVG